MIGTTVRGINAPLQAIGRLLAEPKLRRLAIAPFLINSILFLIGVPLAIWASWVQISEAIDGSSYWGVGLVWLAKVLAVLVVAVISLFLFTLIGTVIAAPFNSALALATERDTWRRNGLEPPAVVERGLVRDAGRAIWYEFARMVIFLAFYPFIWLTVLIPIIGPIAQPILSVLYAAFVISVDFSDYTLDRRIDRFRDKLAYIWNRKSLYFPFGLAAVFMLMIPLINLLILPTCAAATAILFVENEIAEGRGPSGAIRRY